MADSRYEVPPKLPVPPQRECFQSYLDDLSAITSKDEWERASELVGKFTADGGLGQELHRKLEEFGQQADNWAHDYWLNDMYFRMGLSLPVNSNPGMVLRKQHFATDKHWLWFAAEVIRGMVEYKLLIDAEGIAQQYTRNNEPLCMKQYNNMFLTYRRPGVEQDECVRFTDSEHCIVTTKGQHFQLTVFRDGQVRPAEQLAQELQWIVDNGTLDTQLPVGILTTLDRRRWGEAHRLLLDESINAKSLAGIESSLFILCLDDECQVKSDVDVNEETTTLHEMTTEFMQMIHGGGSTAHSRNRWFEKPVQLIINRAGYLGLNYEHSTAEGIPVVAMIEFALNKASKWRDNLESGELENGHAAENGEMDTGKPKHLRWSLSPQLLDILDETCAAIDRLAGDLELRVYRFDLFGKNIPKTHKMSPDCFVQLALQLAYYKSHGHLVATYESASIRRFNLGRVDVIRSATKEAKTWVEAMVHNGISRDEMRRLFRAAMKKQTDVMNKAIRGQGVDNYFIGLREMGIQATGCVPDVFSDDNFKKFNHFALSTSQVPTTDEKTFMGYGPVVSDGYGCSYNLHENQILFCISSWRSCKKTSTKLYAGNLDEGLMEMRNLLEEEFIN